MFGQVFLLTSKVSQTFFSVSHILHNGGFRHLLCSFGEKQPTSFAPLTPYDLNLQKADVACFASISKVSIQALGNCESSKSLKPSIIAEGLPGIPLACDMDAEKVDILEIFWANEGEASNEFSYFWISLSLNMRGSIASGVQDFLTTSRSVSL